MACSLQQPDMTMNSMTQVMEVQPAELSERREYHTSPLEPGKASCLLAACYRRCMVNIQLMDVLDLQLSL